MLICVPVIRERYLRDDVGCGIQGCISCEGSTADVLPSAGDQRHQLFPNGHFILPDTNVFLSQVCSGSNTRDHVPVPFRASFPCLCCISGLVLAFTDGHA